MRRLLIGCLWLSGLCTPGFSQFVYPLNVNVPFGFRVGDAQLEPGEYLVSNGSSIPRAIVVFQSKVRTGSIFLGNRPAAIHIAMSAPSNRETEPSPRVVFNKYGEDRYFVAEIWGAEGGCLLPKSRQERELITSRLVAGRTPERVTIAARISR
jgi:hypothetical protein